MPGLGYCPHVGLVGEQRRAGGEFCRFAWLNLTEHGFTAMTINKNEVF